MSSDVYSDDAVKCNMALKWTWTPMKKSNKILLTPKVSVSNLGSFVVHAQSEIETAWEAMENVDHKHSLNLKGDDWSFGVAYDHLKTKHAGMKATY